MGKPGPKNKRSSHGPLTDQDKLFCQRWLEHFDRNRAYTEAGFKPHPKQLATLAQRKLDRFSEYLRPIQEAKARELAKTLVVDQEQVLQAMARKAVFNPLDYVERTAAPLTEKMTNDKGVVTEGPVLTWDGKPIYGERLKPFSDLTPEQAATVEVTGVVGGRVQYRLPTIREQHQHLTSIGRQYGMFMDKLILERHLHKHKHAHLHLDDVPTTNLQNLTMQLLPLVGAEFANRLGFTQEEIEQAKLMMVAEQGKPSS
jgi:hypothetical protein